MSKEKEFSGQDMLDLALGLSAVLLGRFIYDFIRSGNSPEFKDLRDSQQKTYYDYGKQIVMAYSNQMRKDVGEKSLVTNRDIISCSRNERTN